MRLRAGTPWIFLGSAMMALGLSLGCVGFWVYRDAEATRARIDRPINFSRDYDRIWLGEAEYLIKTLTIVSVTFACVGAYVIDGGRRINRGESFRFYRVG